MNKPADEKIYNKILTLSSYGNELFEDSIISFFKRDYQAADAVISRSEKISDMEKEIFKMILDMEINAKDASSLRLVLDSSRRMIEYSKDIAQVTLNRTVEETHASK
jgi:tRNA threonylcarbamoyladenosine modification (KEOPS) complex  Pcc1 subunit